MKVPHMKNESSSSTVTIPPNESCLIDMIVSADLIVSKTGKESDEAKVPNASNESKKQRVPYAENESRIQKVSKELNKSKLLKVTSPPNESNVKKHKHAKKTKTF